MRTKKVNRYWCDFCNKAGLSASHMAKHEKHCTLNAARECRVCRMIEDGLDSDELDAKKPLADLIAMLPDPAPYHAEMFHHDGEEGEHVKLVAAFDAMLPDFRRAAGGCPACMMAAMRLKKIPVPMMEGFNFTNEMKEIWTNLNESREPRCGYDY